MLKIYFYCSWVFSALETKSKARYLRKPPVSGVFIYASLIKKNGKKIPPRLVFYRETPVKHRHKHTYVLRTPSCLCSRPAIQILLKGWNIHRHTGIALHSSMSNYNQLFTANIKFLTKYIHLVLVYFFFFLIGLTKLSIRFTDGY